jgi:2-methylcitrate dehydratase
VGAIHHSAERPPPDSLLVELAEYATGYRPTSEEAFRTARWCLLDSLGCAMLALNYDDCTNLLGPVVPGAELPGGSRVPGTRHELDPVQAAFNIGATIRWLDFNDTWLAAEWGHPSDNLGAILAIADYLDRKATAAGDKRITVRDVLGWAIKAHEIQGVLAIDNGFNRVGLDHVMLVRIASTAVATAMLGGVLPQTIDALSHAWIDGCSLRTYRHAPNTGSRKSWAAGDATSRAVLLALRILRGEMGYPSALTAKTWGFQDVLYRGKPVTLARKPGEYVMEHVLFKISFPAEFHAQTAVEAALKLHHQVKNRLDDVAFIRIETQESAVRIIDKVGPLANPADRDHCLQYMVAVPLIFGRLTSDDYYDAVAADPRIDALRSKMLVVEEPRFTKDYLDPAQRSIGNAITVTFKDGSSTERVEVEYPVGHRRRRDEGVPLLRSKLHAALATRFPPERTQQIASFADDPARFDATPIDDFLKLFKP